MRRLALPTAALLLSLAGCATSTAPAAAPVITAPDGPPVLSPRDLYKRVAPSVFVVESLDAQGRVYGKGSAVAIAPGQVVTNHHVIADAKTVRLRREDQTWPATVALVDPDRDLARLTVAGLTAPAVTLRLSTTLEQGERVYALGAPRGFELTLSEGLISALRTAPGGRMVQTSAAISQGSSGGGLFDDRGRLIGVTTLLLKESQNLNFAVPCEWVVALAERGRPPGAILPGDAAAAATGGPIGALSDPDRQREAQRLLLEGKARSLAGQHKEAVALLRKGLALRSDGAGGWFFLGFSLLELREYAQAAEAYERALRLEPTSASAWNNLGLAYEAQKRWANAVEAFNRALRLRPVDAGTHESLGRALVAWGRYAQAVGPLEQATALGAKGPLVWLFLGRAYAETRRPDAAVPAFEQSLKRDPKLTVAWYHLGLAHGSSARPKKAAKAFRQATRLAPENAAYWFNLGVALARSGKRPAAVKAYRRAAALDPTNVDSWRYLTVNLLTLDRPKEAAVAGLELTRRAPNEPLSWRLLADAYFADRDHAAAAGAFDRATRLAPTSTPAWLGLGRARAMQGRHKDAEAALLVAVRLAGRDRPKLSNALFSLALVYAGAQRWRLYTETVQTLGRVDAPRAKQLRAKVGR